MVTAPDPLLTNEADFQREVLSHISAWLTATYGNNQAYIESFGLDTVVFIVKNNSTIVRFLEFKAFAGQRPLGVGFGNGRGIGPQVDLLLLPNHMLVALTDTIRWCFSDLTKAQGSNRYAAIDSNTAAAASMGGTAHGKQNNFNVNKALAAPMAWADLLLSLEAFLTV